MSHGYVPVNWNPRKRFYDVCVWICVAVYVGLFIGVSILLYRGEHSVSMPIVLMRALSTCAFLMLTVILCIGPLARLHPRWLPLLYNRRHLGVSAFIIALLHAAVAVYWYHGFGDVNPIISIFTSGGDYRNATDIPFQAFGAVALAILLLLAATSHDYWNANLGASLWKALHMSVYFAYALIVAHIVFGALQQDNTGLLPWMAYLSVLVVGGLHILAGFRSNRAEVALQTAADPDAAGGKNWVAVGDWRAIPNNRAITVEIGADERIAIFRYDETKLAAVANACQHQNGPLGEGRVVDGLITCPWHGYQYRPADGCSPPPFTEKIHTYELKIAGDRLFVAKTPLPRGTARAIVEVSPAAMPPTAKPPHSADA